MTRDEWFTDPNFARHARLVEERLSARKQRLTAVAFCRAAWHLHTHFDIRVAVENAEEFADGAVPPASLDGSRHACRIAAVRLHSVWTQWVGRDRAEELRWWLLHELAWAAAYTASTNVSVPDVGQRVAAALVQTRTGESGVLQVHEPGEVTARDRFAEEAHVLLRSIVWDVAGDPFEPVAFEPDWRTSTAVAIANQMYESRDFSAMPILADALQDAGCEDGEVLNHCRHDGPHVRGCWVVDGVLGKG